MAKLQIFNASGKKTGEISLPERIFSYPIKPHLFYESAVNYRANQRRGTASTKTRGEVSGGGRKPWRQKGTGRARAGSIRSPLWRKGGATFGPRPREYFYELPRKVKRNALFSILSLRLAEDRLLVLERLEFKEPKTKEAKKVLNAFGIQSGLFVDRTENKNLFLALRNIPGVKVVDGSILTAYDVINHEWCVFTQPVLESLMERWQS